MIEKQIRKYFIQNETEISIEKILRKYKFLKKKLILFFIKYNWEVRSKITGKAGEYKYLYIILLLMEKRECPTGDTDADKRRSIVP